MFIALELEKDSTKGMIRFLRGILSKPKPRLEEAEACGVAYWRIRAPLTGDVPDWPAIADVAGRLADRMLFPDGVEPDGDSGVKALCCPDFEIKVLYETACSLVDKTRMPMYRRVLGLIDPLGQYTSLLPGLLKHFTSARVLTQNHREYSRAAEQMMEELGAPVLVGDTLSFLQECVLILAPDRASLPVDSRFPCPVLAGKAFSPPKGADLFCSPRVDASTTLAGVDVPAGVSPHRFAAALCQWGGLDLPSYAAASLLHNYRECTVDEAARALLQSAGFGPEIQSD